jgi:hypothetical protein
MMDNRPKQLIELMREYEVTSTEAICELTRAGMPGAAEYDRGTIRFWVNGQRHEIRPTRVLPFYWTQYALYDLQQALSVLRVALAGTQS